MMEAHLLIGLLLGLAPQSESKDVPREEKVTFPGRNPGQTVTFDLVHIPAGKFKMGSPESEKGRGKNESPVREVAVKPFWMGKYEVSWEEFEVFYLSIDKFADAETRPTMPYEPPDRGMGTGRHPAMSIQWSAARCYCDWLSKKTGQKYRLPTEAEWEYACRAGSEKPAPDPLDDYAWYKGNGKGKNQLTGQKKPNAFGLHDMLGSVWEYCFEFYSVVAPLTDDPWKDPAATHVCEPGGECTHVLRGGSWISPASEVRAAVRQPNLAEWNERDPNRPRSRWWLTDGPFIGFRVLREIAPAAK